MLRIAEHFHDSDLGRQRQGNEDNYYVRAPLFVVADGMGGAQAGEVASEMAVRAFEGGLPDGDPRERLVEVIELANARIYERSRSDSQRAGMGTTLTAAYLADDAVVVAHVGDSRCYLLRGGDLVRLTRDHSLVGELVARGKLTEEQAEAHPQRSVITRALGPEPSVQVDLDVFPARPGDVFLVCSDGLTSMVHEAELKRLLHSGGSLDQIGRRLIAAANAAGGRDNITVILFRLEEVDDRRGRGAQDTGRDGGVRHADARRGRAARGGRGPPRRDARRPTPRRPSTAARARSRCPRCGAATPECPQGRKARRPRLRPASHRRARPRCRTAPARSSAVRRPDGGASAGRFAPSRSASPCCSRSWSGAGSPPGWSTSSARTAPTARPSRSTAGCPTTCPAAIRLYERYAGSGVTLTQVPPRRRSTFTDHKLRSRDDAEDLVIALEKGRLE